jgi:LPS export ABC transporter protein LptC
LKGFFRNSHNNIFPALLLILILLSLLLNGGCRNKLSEIAAFDINDTLPDVTAKNVAFTYSDSAEVQVMLSGPLMYAYNGKEPYTVFPEGFRVNFYDSLFQITTTITGNYGIHYHEKKMMEARENVVVTNYETGEVLNTEELIWDRVKKMIFSNKFVKITSDDGVLFGDGLEAEQDFSKRRIINPSGEIEVKDDD